MEDGTFPALLKTLSDPSEEVWQCALLSSSHLKLYFLGDQTRLAAACTDLV